MNIYEKLANARVELQEMKLKKSGKNQSISYYELGDFLPAINALGKKHGFITEFSIDTNARLDADEKIFQQGETAILRVRDIQEDKDGVNDCIVFRSPTAEVDLPRGQKIQGLGAKITYMRRYMLMTAFEIVESDMVDRLAIDLKDSIDEEDEAKIRACKTQKELSAVCNALTNKYKQSLITPIYDEVKIKLAQSESEA